MNLKHVLLLLNWYDYRIHRGVSQVAQEAGWQLICPTCDHDLDRILDGWQGDGCIALATNNELLEHFYSLNIPMVDLGLTNHKLPIPRLVTDNMEIGRLAAEYFMDHGYREVFVANPGVGGFHLERHEALKHHVEAKGGRVTVVTSRKGNWAKAYEEFQLIATERGTRVQETSIAFFAYDDYSAAELISLCLEKGLQVPENVAVLGVDNDELINSGLVISLSSVDSDLEGLGRSGAQLLRNSFEHPDTTWEAGRIMRHPPKGIIGRKSTDYYAVRSPMVAKALHWIHNNYQDAIQAIDVSKALGITQQGLQRAFAQHHLRSPGEEIRYQRVHAVNHRLIHSSDPLETIAYACGYNSVHSLIRNYRAVFGITPGQRRKKK